MTTLISSDLEIVGLNGVPSVECGRSLPVVRRKSDGMYSVLKTVANPAAPSWHDEEDAAAFAVSKRWTKLREPLPFPASCVSGEDGRLIRQPMMIHVASMLLTAAGLSARPDSFGFAFATPWPGREGSPRRRSSRHGRTGIPGVSATGYWFPLRGDSIMGIVNGDRIASLRAGMR